MRRTKVIKDINKDLFENINPEILAKNNRRYGIYRTYGALNAGIVSGLFGLTGFMGIVTYIAIFFIISYVLLMKTNNKPTDFFVKKGDIHGGIGSDVTLFLMSWVISHNLVNIL